MIKLRPAVLGLGVLLLSMFAALPVFAQAGAGVLIGTVRDASNKKPAVDVVVTVTSVALQGEEIGVTDNAGQYRIPNLPPGKYTIRFEKETYRPFSRPDIELRVDTTLRIDAELMPEAIKAEKEIVVIGRPPTVDVGSSQTGNVVEEEFTSRIPTARPAGKGGASRSIESVAAVTAQADGDDYGVGINGTTSPENSYVIDGLSVGDPSVGLLGTSLSMEFVKQLNVITGGYMPEYGKATGGILNAVTKTGSNEFHGSAWAYYTPGQLEGSRRLIKRESQTINTEQGLRAIYDFGADIGGPIVHDKLWFYFGVDFAESSYRLNRSLWRTLYDASGATIPDEEGYATKELIPGSEKEYLALERSLQLFTKLTYTANPRHRFHLTAIGIPQWTGGGGNFAMDPQQGGPEVTAIDGQYNSLAHNLDNYSTDLALKWNYSSPNKRVLVDTMFGWHRQNSHMLPVDGSDIGDTTGLASLPQVIWRRSTPGYHSITDFEDISDPTLCTAPIPGAPAGTVRCPVTGYVNGGIGYMEKITLNRYQAQTITTLVGRLAGSHVIKGGLDVDYSQYDHINAFSGKVVLRESTKGGSFTDYRMQGFLQGPDDAIILDNLHHNTSSLNLGGFVQDAWSIVDKITLNAGVRYDAQMLFNDVGKLGLTMPNMVSPRVGLIFDPTQSGRSKLFANFARFYESMPLKLADRAASGDPQISSVHPRTSATCNPRETDPANGACFNTDERINQGGATSPDKQWVVSGGGITPVDPDLSPQSSSEIMGGGEYDIWQSTRLGVSYTKRWMNNVIEDMSNDEAQTYFIGNPGQGIASSFPEAKRDYDAFTFYVSKTLFKNWLAQASYTLSWLRGNYAGLYRPETGQLDPNINSDFDLQSLTVNRDGPLPGDSRHNFKFYGAYDFQLPRRNQITLGGSALLSSGGPTDYLGSHPLYGNDEVFILPRGSGPRLPWSYRYDVHVGYRFETINHYGLTLTVDVFNILNLQRTAARSTRYTTADVKPIVNGTPADLGTLVHVDGTPFDDKEINPNFGNTIAFQAPRTFRFGLRGEF